MPTLDDTVLQRSNVLSKYEGLIVLNSFDKKINFIPHYRFSKSIDSQFPNFNITLFYFNLVFLIIKFVISVVFYNKLDWSVSTV